MTRLLVHVEGQTEEDFVKEVLVPQLAGFGFSSVSARLVGNPRQRDRRGGIRAWPEVRKEILNHLREDGECLASTMVDYYALPQAGSKAWPGRAAAAGLAFAEKATTVQQALLDDVCHQMGNSFNPNRFIPYVMIHEFEALLFSDCGAFAHAIGYPNLAPSFQAIRDDFECPEEINDSPVTAPAKRIEKLVPGYQKPFHGVLAVLEIGLPIIRSECPNFRGWLERLETSTAAGAA